MSSLAPCPRICLWPMSNFPPPTRKLIDQALKVWSTNKLVYKPELARTSFLKARVLFQQNDDKRALELFKEAVELRNSVPNAKSKPDRDLEEKDFDNLVTFWSR